ncbi:ADP-ribosylglycohydrolase [Sarocladium strictum]
MSSSSLTPYQSRVIGALLGVHAGDSLGATFEFTTHAWIIENYPNGLRDIVGGGAFNWKAGHATDDTDMTRAILLAYQDLHRLPEEKKKQDTKESNIVYLAADHFLEWFTGNNWPDRRPNSRPDDIGGATASGLSSYTSSHNPFTSGAGPGSAGNGSLMRCIPTAAFAADSDTRFKDSIQISAITHDDPRCTAACAAYNEIAAELIKGSSPEAAVAAGERLLEDIASRPVEKLNKESLITGAKLVLSAIQLGRQLSIPDLAQNGPPSTLPGKCGGFVLETLTLGIAAVLDTRSFDDVLVDVVRIGKDTDTNGAVAGGLLGARDGVEAIPEAWREIIQFGKEFYDIALELTSS